jgi:hypothetical protein
MPQEAIVTLLLVVGCILSAIMAVMSRVELPGQDEYRPVANGPRGSGRADPLGRDDGRAPWRDPAHERAGWREAPRFHANGSSAHGRDRWEDAPDNGFEAWARAQGHRWSERPPMAPPSPSGPHWSQVLGVPRSAGEREIRSAYARVMRGLHPDVAPQDATTSQRCAEAQAAYRRGREDAKAHGRS